MLTTVQSSARSTITKDWLNYGAAAAVQTIPVNCALQSRYDESKCCTTSTIGKDWADYGGDHKTQAFIQGQKKQKLSRLQDFSPKNFLDKACKSLILRQMCVKLDNFMCFIRIAFGLSGQFLEYPDNLMIIRTVSRLSGQFLNYSNSLWIIRTVSRIFGQSLNSFLTIQKVSLPTGQFWTKLYALVHILTGFLQKLSG